MFSKRKIDDRTPYLLLVENPMTGGNRLYIEIFEKTDDDAGRRATKVAEALGNARATGVVLYKPIPDNKW